MGKHHKRAMRFLILRVLLIVCAHSSLSFADEITSERLSIDSFPKALDPNCRDGSARLYDECRSQQSIFSEALELATTSKKAVLIVYGAEWCVWCFKLDDRLHGEYSHSVYQYRQDANTKKWSLESHEDIEGVKDAVALNRFVAEHFVIAHIEGHFSSDGNQVIDDIGYNSADITFVPYLLSVNTSGQYAAHLPAYEAMRESPYRTDEGKAYREFDSKVLLLALQTLHKAAMHAKF